MSLLFKNELEESQHAQIVEMANELQKLRFENKRLRHEILVAYCASAAADDAMCDPCCCDVATIFGQEDNQG